MVSSWIDRWCTPQITQPPVPYDAQKSKKTNVEDIDQEDIVQAPFAIPEQDELSVDLTVDLTVDDVPTAIPASPPLSAQSIESVPYDEQLAWALKESLREYHDPVEQALQESLHEVQPSNVDHVDLKRALDVSAPTTPGGMSILGVRREY